MTLTSPDTSLLGPTTREEELASLKSPITVTSFEALPEHKALHFIGAHHEIGTNSPTHRTVKAAVEKFKPDLVIVEGFFSTDKPINSPQNIEIVKRDMANAERVSESSYAASLAIEKGIDFTSGEPSWQQISRHLATKGYTANEIMSLGIMLLMTDMVHSNTLPVDENLLRTKITDFIEGDSGLFGHIPKEQRISYDEFKSVCEEKTTLPIKTQGNQPSVQDIRKHLPKEQRIAYEKLRTLLPFNIASFQYFFEEMGDAMNEARDKHIVELIHKNLDTYNSVLVVYGDMHRVAQLPVLQKMFDQQGITEQLVEQRGRVTNSSQGQKGR